MILTLNKLKRILVGNSNVDEWYRALTENIYFQEKNNLNKNPNNSNLK